MTFSEDNQPALFIALLKAPFQQRVETLADLFRSRFNRIFAVAMGRFLDNRAEEAADKVENKADQVKADADAKAKSGDCCGG